MTDSEEEVESFQQEDTEEEFEEVVADEKDAEEEYADEGDEEELEEISVEEKQALISQLLKSSPPGEIQLVLEGEFVLYIIKAIYAPNFSS